MAALLDTVHPPSEDAQRVASFAYVIGDAVEDAGVAPFTGDDSELSAAMALVAIGWHESGFKPDIVHCRWKGDSGRSVSAWQLWGPWAWFGHTHDEVCGSTRLAATLAVRVLGVHAVRCSRSSWRGLFNGYASGDCSKPSRAATDMCASWQRLCVGAGLTVSCDNRRPARRM